MYGALVSSVVDGRGFFYHFWIGDEIIKKNLKFALRKARHCLIRHKALLPSTFHLKSKNPAVPSILVQPQWHDEGFNEDRLSEIHKLCRFIDASEVVIVGKTHLYAGDNQTPISEAIMASVEDLNGIHKVVLPYTMRPNGKVTFGKEIGEPARNTIYEPDIEGLVQ